jgi:hypothetical protein
MLNGRRNGDGSFYGLLHSHFKDCAGGVRNFVSSLKKCWGTTSEVILFENVDRVEPRRLSSDRCEDQKESRLRSVVPQISITNMWLNYEV